MLIRTSSMKSVRSTVEQYDVKIPKVIGILEQRQRDMGVG